MLNSCTRKQHINHNPSVYSMAELNSLLPTELNTEPVPLIGFTDILAVIGLCPNFVTELLIVFNQ